MIARYFSLNAWMPTIRAKFGDVNLIGLGFDWYCAGSIPSYYAIDAHLFGFGASIVFWPKGKSLDDDEHSVDDDRPDYLHDFGPNVPVEDLGGKPCYYENGEPVYWEKAP